MKIFKDSGIIPIIISISPFGLLKEKIDRNKIESYSLGKNSLLNIFTLISLIIKIKPDKIIMTGHSILGLIVLGLFFRDIKKTLSIHYHHKGLKNLYVWRLYYFLSSRTYSSIIFCSNYIRDEAISIYPSIAQQSVKINNPIYKVTISSKKDKKLSREKYNISSSVKVIGGAGWLIERKRFDIPIRILCELTKLEENYILLIAGDGPEKNSLIKLANKLKIGSRIKWIGWQDSLDDFFNCLDFMIFSSEIDAMGLVPLEALVRKIPTFCSVRHGGLKEILNGDFSYFIHNNHDVHAIVNKIMEHNEHKDKVELVSKCCNHILNKSNINDIANLLLRNI